MISTDLVRKGVKLTYNCIDSYPFSSPKLLDSIGDCILQWPGKIHQKWADTLVDIRLTGNLRLFGTPQLGRTECLL